MWWLASLSGAVGKDMVMPLALSQLFTLSILSLIAEPQTKKEQFHFSILLCAFAIGAPWLED